jgi:hypothetical protein
LTLFTKFKPLSVFGLEGGVNLLLIVPLSLIPFFIYDHFKGWRIYMVF